MLKLMFATFIFSSVIHASVDSVAMSSDGVKIPEKRFQEIIEFMEDDFQEYSRESGRDLEILANYSTEWPQAYARRWETDQVIVYGGIAALKNGSEDSFVMILCHELGHLYGGEPYSDIHNKLSLEGQADYWASNVCWKKIYPRLSFRSASKSSLEYCRYDEVCARAVDASLVVTAFFADNRNLPHPRVDTPDLRVVKETLRTHPEPQCRLDTILAGLSRGPLPLCWFAPPGN